MKVSRQTLSAGLSGVALLAGNLAAQPVSAQQKEPSTAKPSSGMLSMATEKLADNKSQLAGLAATTVSGDNYRGFQGRLSQPIDLPRPLATDSAPKVRFASATGTERPAPQRIAQTMVVPGGSTVPDTSTESSTTTTGDQATTGDQSTMGQTTTEQSTMGDSTTTATAATSSQRRYRVGPSTTFYTPSGFGLRRRQAVLWALYQADTRNSSEDDGSIGATVGLGNPDRLGLDVGVNFLSLFGGRGDDAGFGERGSFNFKLHRRIRPDLSVAVGVRNTLIWDGSDSPTRYYAVASKVFSLKPNYRDSFSRLYASLGIERSSVGSQNDPFRREAQSVIDEFGRTNVFGSLAVKLAEPVNAFVEWSGEDLNAGVSFVPFRNVPLVVTPAIVDITGKASDDARFNLAVAYLFNF
jgi:hypothetical protein